ncbi:MAG TPA: bifunctional riboflavin kinase/FAD synthetase [Ferruginibacter sp.]|mgnify:CR=1 FL=1|nr:bifunctional riboflavin kinase/FAD synthetase [Ferruginibacter sp.]HRO05750.1 bifunctional riboflavin kinase/FAD synthetase [Ferruginibacter sp.]HRO95956.1 bifunctional riboflavin kinase/FAD synthetase [Ferruginibacter sp.]HRP48707.1 bifunctional riboflavin kinase/FAD synthetase [Ferruginibacter sp.]
MQIHRNIEALPQLSRAVLTIGTFDGVHLGHARIMQQLVQTAAAIGGTTVVITFYPHPRHVIEGEAPIGLLTTQEEKYAILERAGIDHLVEIPFNKTFAEQTAEAYIEHFLVRYFKPHTIITGYDHKFGKGRKGDYTLLEEMGKKFNYTVKEIPAEVLEQVSISSTRIRVALTQGDVEKASEYLGYPYTLSGLVVQGAQKGRTIQFPTANLQITDQEKLIPAHGVYAVRVTVQGKVYKGMLNIGNRPTVNGTHTTIEVHILDFNDEIYGSIIQLAFIYKLRDEQRFPNLDALKQQLEADLIRVNTLLEDLSQD